MSWEGPPRAAGFYPMPGSTCTVPRGRVEDPEGLPLPGTVDVPVSELLFFQDHGNQGSAFSGIMAKVWQLGG